MGRAFLRSIFLIITISVCAFVANSFIGARLAKRASLPDMYNPDARLVNSVAPSTRSAGSGQGFGYSTAISEDGKYLVVGAYQDGYDLNGLNFVNEAGAVLVYENIAGTWTLIQRISGEGLNARSTSTKFGQSVAISGDTIVVGAPFSNYDSNGANILTGAGAIFVFVKNGSNFQLQQRITPTGTNNRMSSDNFGEWVAISGDHIAVGTPNQDYDATGANNLGAAGAVFMYSRSGGVWTQGQKLVSPLARSSSEKFGFGVAMSGSTVVIGAPFNDTDASGGNTLTDAGAVFVYTESAGTWTLQQKIVGEGTGGRVASDNFGTSVAISGDSIIVGAPLQDTDAAGGSSLTAAGAAFVYKRSAGVWSFEQKIVGSGTNGRLANHKFGTTVAISSDIVAIGAPSNPYDAAGANALSSAGIIFVFNRSGSVWSMTDRLVGEGVNARMINDYVGSVGLTLMGEELAIGVPDQDYDANGGDVITGTGAVFVKRRTAGVWSQSARIVDQSKMMARALSAAAQFGNAVAISEDRMTIVIGCALDDFDVNGENEVNDAGAVYVYTFNAGVLSLQQKIIGTGLNGRVANDNFGKSVDISGETLVVGAPGQDTNALGASAAAGAGAVFVYTRFNGVWTLQQKIVGEGTNGRLSGDGMGFSVTIDGDTIATGVYSQDYDAAGAGNVTNAGAVYVYTRSAGVWSFQQKLVGTGTNSRITSDYLGYSVDISGDTIVAGAYQHGYDATGANVISQAGAAWVWTRSGGVWSLQQKLTGVGTNSRVSGDKFGTSVSIYGDMILVGAPFQDTDSDGATSIGNAGAAWAFRRNAGVWNVSQKLVPTGTNARATNNEFGTAVSINNGVAIIGSPNNYFDADGGASVPNAGAAFIYTFSMDSWLQRQKVAAFGVNSRVSGDTTATTVAIVGKRAVVGSINQDYDSSGANLISNAGAAFVFTRP